MPSTAVDTLETVAALGSATASAPPVASSSTLNQATNESTAPCVFCGITTTSPGFKVLHEDDEFVVIRDRSPGSNVHLLAIPKAHIPNVKSLTTDDTEMLVGLERVGRKVLDELGVSEVHQRLGFHIPPFYSVDHLHLHLLSTPLIGLKSRLKYRPSVPTSSNPSTPSNPSKPIATPAKIKVKGWSWFVSVSQVRTILDGGGKVKVGPVWITPSLEL